ncbi:hypothetical protein FXO38_06800 [Capsicum annuum]|nr:hypothetical protein FXO38_06800 [Capsicum annuum]KAF3673241.1 hypothetical protein FXO37_07100 [Capsicum annuum]
MDMTLGKITDNRKALRECQMTLPKTPSPNQPFNGNYGIKRELGNYVKVGAIKCHPRIAGNVGNSGQNGESLLFGNRGNMSRSVSTYAEIFSSVAQYFGRIRLGMNLFAVNDEKFIDMFIELGAIDSLENEWQSLQK